MFKSRIVYPYYSKEGLLNRSIQYDTPTAGGEGSQPSGGDDDEGKAFSQKELNAILKKERKAAEDKYKKQIEDLNSEHSTKLSEFEEQLNKLKQDQEDEKLSATERERKAFERAQEEANKRIKKLQEELNNAKTSHDAVNGTLVRERKERQLGAALTEAKVYQESFSDALAIFSQATKVEMDEHGVVTSINFNDIPYSKPLDAAKAFLESKPYFSGEKPSGAGTRTPNGLPGKASLWELPPDQLLALDKQSKG